MGSLNRCGFEMALGNGASTHEFATVSGAAWEEHADAARTGSYGLKCVASSSQGWVEFEAQGNGQDGAGEAFFQRIYIQVPTGGTPSATTRIMEWSSQSGANFGISLKMTTSRTLQVFDRQASPTQIESDSAALDLDKWYRFEWSANWTNNEVIARLTNISGGPTEFVNNKSTDGDAHNWGASGGIETMFSLNVGIGLDGNVTGTIYYDDFAWNDNVSITGPVNQNTWPGAGNVVVLRPNAAGTTNLGTYVGGAGDATNLADAPPSTSSYWLGDIANDVIETNATASGITGHSSIPVVMLGCIVASDTAGAMSYAPRIRSSSTTANGTTTTVNSTTFVVHSATGNQRNPKQVAYRNPSGPADWTVTSIDALEIGAIVPDATPDVRVGEVWAYVEYAPTTEFPAAGGAAAYRLALQGVG